MTRSSAGNDNGVGIHFRPARGLSLLEVVLAMAILAASMAVVSQLVGLGLRAAGQSRNLTQAQILAESLMSEISAGITPAEPLQPTLIEPGWYASIYLQPSLHQGIVQLIVRVEQDSTSRRAAHFELTRWMRDPTLEIPTESTTTSDASGSSSSSDDGSAGQPNDQTPTDGSGDPNADGGPNNGGPPGGQGGRGGRGGRGDGAGRGGPGGGDDGPGQGGGRGNGGGRGGGRGGRGDGNVGPGQGGGRGGGNAGPGQGSGRGRGGGATGGGRGGGQGGRTRRRSRRRTRWWSRQPGGGQGQPGGGAGPGGGPAAGGGGRR